MFRARWGLLHAMRGAESQRVDMSRSGVSPAADRDQIESVTTSVSEPPTFDGVRTYSRSSAASVRRNVASARVGCRRKQTVSQLLVLRSVF
jgi:hypothetical protein